MNKENKNKVEATSWLHKILTGLGLSSGISKIIATAIIAAIAAVMALLNTSCNGKIEPWHIDTAADIIQYIIIEEEYTK